MSNDEDQERKFLVDAFTEDGWFYIIDKKALLITDDSEIKLGVLMQFEFPDKKGEIKIRKGELIMESGKYT